MRCLATGKIGTMSSTEHDKPILFDCTREGDNMVHPELPLFTAIGWLDAEKQIQHK